MPASREGHAGALSLQTYFKARDESRVFRVNACLLHEVGSTMLGTLDVKMNEARPRWAKQLCADFFWTLCIKSTVIDG